MAREQEANCCSCGDVIYIFSNIDSYELQDAMRARCYTCACEVLGLGIPKIGTLQHYKGNACRVIKETKTH